MRKIKNIFLSLLLIFFISNINILIKSTKYASNLFFNKIFISIFPFIILIDILIYYDYHLFLEKIFGNFISKLFNVPRNITMMIILSIFLPSPSNALILKDMLDNKSINEDLTSNILTFTFTNSMPFVIGSVGIYLYNSLTIGIILYIFMILNNILIGIFVRKNNYNIKCNIIKIKKESNIFIVLKNSILKAFNTSMIILGNLIVSMCLINLIKEYTNINTLVFSIISGLIEITNGIVLVSDLNNSLIIKLTITLFLLSFNGLSIIFQSISILSNYKINIKRILIIKLAFSIIISILFMISISIAPIISFTN